VAEQEACRLLAIRSTWASKHKANVGQKKRKGAPEEKEAKRQRTEEAEKKALRLYFKGLEEVGGCGVAARKCRTVLWPVLRRPPFWLG
jgi:hypothetical protein